MLQLSPLAKEGCRVGDLILDADCSGQKGHDVTLIVLKGQEKRRIQHTVMSFADVLGVTKAVAVESGRL